MKRLAFISAVALVASVASAQIVNGDFETGSLAPWVITPTANGVTGVQDVTVFDMDFSGGGAASRAARFDVGQIVFDPGVQEGIEMTQTISLTGGAAYVISFDWAASRASATFNSEGGVFSIIVDGVALATAAAGLTNNTTENFGTLNANYVPAATTTYVVGARITRPFQRPGDVFQHVDNYTVVPEPASMIALGLGAAALLARRRRKKAA